MKTLFFGTPEIAVPFLDACAARSEVLAVVSQPDKPAGRGLSVEPTPVKKKALELGLRVLQPERPSAAAAELKALKADAAVVVAYGRILKPDVLEATRLGFLNVHFSLLPKYRGAAPVQWALCRGEPRTGVSLFWLDAGMDTGPLQSTRETVVGPDEDAPALFERLTQLGLESLGDFLADGTVVREPQKGEPSLAPLIKKADAQITKGLSAPEIHNLVRGMRIWPRAWFILETDNGPLRVQILKTTLKSTLHQNAASPPWSIVGIEPEGGVLVQLKNSTCISFLAVQPEGKKPVSAADFLNGLRMKAGDVLPIKD